MAETDFILNIDEQKELVVFLLNQGVEFIPSINYKNKEFDILSSPDDIEAIIKSGTLVSSFFLPLKINKPYQFEFGTIEKEGNICYYVAPRQGTPCLKFLPCFHKFRYQPPLYISGFIAYYKSYFKGENRTETPVPAEVKDLYKRVVKYIRTICISPKTKNVGTRYWVGHKALEDIKNGISINVDDLQI